MSFAPQQNWKLYESLVSEYEAKRDRERSPSDGFDTYCDIFQFIKDARQSIDNHGQPSTTIWPEKFEERKRQIEAFEKLEPYFRAK